MKEQIKQSATILAPLGTLGAFIADVLTPLGPFTKWLFIIISIFSVITFILYLKKVTFGKKYFLPSVVLSVIFGFLFFFSGGTKNGILGDNIDSISSIQRSLFNIEESLDKIDEKLDIRFDKIEELITSSNPIANPKTANDFIVNAYLYKNSGNLVKSEESFRKFIDITNLEKFDVFKDYYDVLKINYGKVKALEVLNNTSNSPMVEVINVIENNSGRNILYSIEKIDSLDVLLKKWLHIYTFQKYFMMDMSAIYTDMCAMIEYYEKAHASLEYAVELEENFSKVQHFFMNKMKLQEGIDLNVIYLSAQVPSAQKSMYEKRWNDLEQTSKDYYDNSFESFMQKTSMAAYKDCENKDAYWFLMNNPPHNPNN